MTSTQVLCSLGGLAKTMDSRNITIEVSNNGVDYLSSGVRYTYRARPRIRSLSPRYGLEGSATPITIVSQLDGQAHDIHIKIGDEPAWGIVQSGGSLSCTAPAQQAGRRPVAVSMDGGSSFVSTGLWFEYITRPVVLELVPSSGPWEGGTETRVVGMGFIGVDHNISEGVTGWGCIFGASDVMIEARWASSTELRCISPMHHGGGTVRVMKREYSHRHHEHDRAEGEHCCESEG